MRKILKNGSVLILDGNLEFRKLDLVMEDGIIKALTSPGTDYDSEYAKVLDCTGNFIIPGLVDAHNHLGLLPGNEDDEIALMQQPDATIALRAANNALHHLRSGVTSLRSVGEKNYIDLSYRAAIDQGIIPGPTLRVSGPGIVATGGPCAYIHEECDGKEEIRKAVRTRAKMGVDTIKVFVSGTSVHENTLPRQAHFSQEELDTLVEEARRVGLPVCSHISGGPGAMQALRAGIDIIEHGFLFEDSLLEEMARTNTPLVLTPGMMEVDLDQVPAWKKERLLVINKKYPEVIRKARSYNLKMAVGADCNHAPYYLANLLIGLTKFGLTSEDILRMATINGAKICGFAKTGEIKEGNRADLLVLEQNPLQNIAALTSIKSIFKAGLPVEPL